MSKIKAMLIHNIEFDDGRWGERWVHDFELKGYSQYNDNIDMNMFFHLATERLEDQADVFSTEDAKIDYYEEEE